METRKELSYTRRDIIITVIIILVATLILGDLNTNTQSISTTSDGPLSISTNVTCTGFGEPTYYNTMDPELNYTTYQYGTCFFGFWVSNGQPVNIV